MSDCRPILLPEGPFLRKQTLATTTAHRNAFIEDGREHISGELSTMPKGSYAGGARILNLMPENSQIRISPAGRFLGDKRLHLIHQVVSSPGDAASSFIPLIHS